MAKIRLSSDLLETDFLPEEEYLAKTFQSRDLSLAYLQNMKVEVIRQIGDMSFANADGTEDKTAILRHAELLGMKNILVNLINDALNAEPPAPVGNPS